MIFNALNSLLWSPSGDTTKHLYFTKTLFYIYSKISNFKITYYSRGMKNVCGTVNPITGGW